MKKKMRSILTVAIAGMMAASVMGLVACNNSSDESGKVVMAFVAGTNLLPDESKVEAAVDAYCEETYGIGVTFKHVNIYDQASIYTNWLGANEEIDILNLCFVDPMQYINEKRIRPRGRSGLYAMIIDVPARKASSEYPRLRLYSSGLRSRRSL